MKLFLSRIWFILKYPSILRIIRKVRTQKLSYLGVRALIDLAMATTRVELCGVPGIFIEAGCALGGSAIIIATSKKNNRELFLFDTFGLIPPPSTKDGQRARSRYKEIIAGKSSGISGSEYYGYKKNIKKIVTDNFIQFGFNLKQDHINLKQGLFGDTLKPQNSVALAHIDCDWYSSVKLCLERIVPHLSIGGMLVIDDYYDWEGCKKAVDEYFSGKMEQYQFSKTSRLLIKKIGIS